jgi:hypothetical protein
MLGQAGVKTAFRILLTLFFLLSAYEVMVAAFHLLNAPSDRSVFEGVAILAVLAVCLPLLFVRIWRSS